MKWSIFGKRGKIETSPQPDSPPPPVSTEGRGKRVLIVDDDPIIIKTTSMKLKSHAYEVFTAMDASEAMSAVRQCKPDLILLDITFPPDVGIDWDGFKIIAWLQRVEEGKNVPIIVISSGEAARYEKRALAEGAVAFFNKPLRHDELFVTMERTLRTPRQTDSVNG